MPILTERQIKEKIASGSISAISVDTAVFDNYQCDLDHAVLARLDQFRNSGVKLLLSEIVINEIKSHIANEALETQRSLQAALKKHSRRWKLKKNLDPVKAELNLGLNAVQVAQEQVDSFLLTVGAQVVPATGKGDLTAEVLRRYFESVTPFETRETKKHEFPDAFALLSLEQAAADRDTLILCVSPDKGWATFAEKSERLVIVPKIAAALSLFNDSGRNVAEKIVAMWKANSATALDSELERAFEVFLDGRSFHIESDSELSYDSELTSAVLQFVDVDTIESPAVIAADDSQVTFTVKAQATIGFEAEFSFYAHDSVDGHDIGLGSRSSYIEWPLPFEIAISVSREIDDGQFDIYDVNVTSPQKDVDFGYIHPFPDDDPTHEKY